MPWESSVSLRPLGERGVRRWKLGKGVECLRGGAAVHGFACCVAVHVVVLSSGGGMYETSSYVVGVFSRASIVLYQ